MRIVLVALVALIAALGACAEPIYSDWVECDRDWRVGDTGAPPLPQRGDVACQAGASGYVEGQTAHAGCAESDSEIERVTWWLDAGTGCGPGTAGIPHTWHGIDGCIHLAVDTPHDPNDGRVFFGACVVSK